MDVNSEAAENWTRAMKAESRVESLEGEIERLLERPAMSLDSDLSAALRASTKLIGTMVPIEEIEAMRAALKRLRSAAEAVCAYDWSDNDPDAVAAIDALRTELSSGQ